MNYELFEDLAQEHKTFLLFLERVVRSPTFNSASWKQFAFLLENVHHHKEENFLFPLLLGGNELQVGGPKCMTFFTPRVIGGTGWIDSFANLKAIFPDCFPKVPPLSPLYEEVLQQGSMLRIPMEDHILGGTALEKIIAENGKAPELIRAFASLLKDHIQREDECLLELFRRELTPEEKKKYSELAHDFDKKTNTSARLQELAATAE